MQNNLKYHRILCILPLVATNKKQYASGNASIGIGDDQLIGYKGIRKEFQ